MTNLELNMKYIESRWIQLPEEVRAAYGQKYLEKFRVNINSANDSCVFVYLFLKHSKSGRLIFTWTISDGVTFIMLIHATSV